MTTDEKMKLPKYVPQGRPLVRTKNPRRPEWLDTIKRPLLVIAQNERHYERFLFSWKFDVTEARQVLLTNDLRGVSFGTVILVLPGARNDSVSMIIDIDPLNWWEQRGGITVDIPDNAMMKPFEFSLEDNLAASTKVAIAQHRHLDSLNSR